MLLAAIIFSWMAYGFYQPKILESLGFAALANSLGVIQGLLGSVVEPFVGVISDRLLGRIGSRLPMIAAGATVAGLIFVALSVLLQLTLPMEWRWIVPVLMTVWVMAMIVFRGPAIAILRQLAPSQQLPKANAILTLVFGLTGAIGPIFASVIDALGATLTFFLGSIVLLGGALLFSAANPRSSVFTTSAQVDQFLSSRDAGCLFALGLGIGGLVNLMLRECPIVLGRISESRPEWMAAGILLVGAIAAVPLEKWISRVGSRAALVTSLGLFLVQMGLLNVIGHPYVVGLAIATLGVTFALLFTSQIPCVLAIAPPNQAGTATGFYFGGMGAATALVTLANQQRYLNPDSSLLISFAAAALAVSSLLATRPASRD
jgi:MFS family permease